MKFNVITLCGSTKFKDEFIQEQKRLTLEGNIVISVGLFGHSGDTEVWTDDKKEMLDRMHKQKIDMSNEIFVINVGGYIGDSTAKEIEYAKKKGKVIKYYECVHHNNTCYKTSFNRKLITCLDCNFAWEEVLSTNKMNIMDIDLNDYKIKCLSSHYKISINDIKDISIKILLDDEDLHENKELIKDVKSLFYINRDLIIDIKSEQKKIIISFIGEKLYNEIINLSSEKEIEEMKLKIPIIYQDYESHMRKIESIAKKYNINITGNIDSFLDNDAEDIESFINITRKGNDLLLEFSQKPNIPKDDITPNNIENCNHMNSEGKWMLSYDNNRGPLESRLSKMHCYFCGERGSIEKLKGHIKNQLTVEEILKLKDGTKLFVTDNNFYNIKKLHGEIVYFMYDEDENVPRLYRSLSKKDEYYIESDFKDLQVYEWIEDPYGKIKEKEKNKGKLLSIEEVLKLKDDTKLYVENSYYDDHFGEDSNIHEMKLFIDENNQPIISVYMNRNKSYSHYIQEDFKNLRIYKWVEGDNIDGK